ncbi:MAG TPA: sugar O-acetyltransferase [Lachnospiraceae bacterium]|nr:sugar O-acetyltransferase [Lachnospiraceae bacterium]
MTIGEIKERMHDGRLYLPGNESLMEEQVAYQELLYEYNNSRPAEAFKRIQLLDQMLAEVGEGSYIEPPLRANFGGHHVHLGRGVYANYNLTLVDDTHIYIGDFCMFGPNVTVVTAGHPNDPELRERGYQFNLPVKIGRNVWIGCGATILPGVTIGDDSVIGAGSVVAKDIPSGVLAYGNPCEVIRELTDIDREFYHKGRKIDYDDLPE